MSNIVVVDNESDKSIMLMNDEGISEIGMYTVLENGKMKYLHLDEKVCYQICRRKNGGFEPYFPKTSELECITDLPVKNSYIFYFMSKKSVYIVNFKREKTSVAQLE